MAYIDEVLEMMRKNPQARIVRATCSSQPFPLEPFQADAGYVWLEGPTLRGHNFLRAFEVDLLLKEGIIEEERESWEAIYYKLSESANCQHRWHLMSDGVGVNIGRICEDCGKEEYDKRARLR